MGSAIAEQLDLFADTQGLTVSALREILGGKEDTLASLLSTQPEIDAKLVEIAEGRTGRARKVREDLATWLGMQLAFWRMDETSPGWNAPLPKPERPRPSPKAASGKEIPEEIRALLRSGTREGDVYRLPEGHLDRAVYDAAMKVLSGLGFKWSRSKKAHVCGPHGQPERLWEVLDAGKAVDLKQELQFFATPPAVVARVLELADLERGLRCLEPSAGTGNLARAMRQAVGEGGLVHCCEIHPPFVDGLVRDGFDTWPGDFLKAEDEEFEPYDRVVMNPPFAKGQDIEHVWKAFRQLRPGGLLVSVMHPGWQTGGTKREAAFRAWVAEHGGTVEDVAAGAFRESGTDVPTVILRVAKEAA